MEEAGGGEEGVGGSGHGRYHAASPPIKSRDSDSEPGSTASIGPGLDTAPRIGPAAGHLPGILQGERRKLCHSCNSAVGSLTRACPHCNATPPLKSTTAVAARPTGGSGEGGEVAAGAAGGAHGRAPHEPTMRRDRGGDEVALGAHTEVHGVGLHGGQTLTGPSDNAGANAGAGSRAMSLSRRERRAPEKYVPPPPGVGGLAKKSQQPSAGSTRQLPPLGVGDLFRNVQQQQPKTAGMKRLADPPTAPTPTPIGTKQDEQERGEGVSRDNRFTLEEEEKEEKEEEEEEGEDGGGEDIFVDFVDGDPGDPALEVYGVSKRLCTRGEQPSAAAHNPTGSGSTPTARSDASNDGRTVSAGRVGGTASSESAEEAGGSAGASPSGLYTQHAAVGLATAVVTAVVVLKEEEEEAEEHEEELLAAHGDFIAWGPDLEGVGGRDGEHDGEGDNRDEATRNRPQRSAPLPGRQPTPEPPASPSIPPRDPEAVGGGEVRTLPSRWTRSESVSAGPVSPVDPVIAPALKASPETHPSDSALGRRAEALMIRLTRGPRFY